MERLKNLMQPHFSIRKLTIGAVSVMFSAFLWSTGNGQAVHADTNEAKTEISQEQVNKAVADAANNKAVDVTKGQVVTPNQKNSVQDKKAEAAKSKITADGTKIADTAAKSADTETKAADNKTATDHEAVSDDTKTPDAKDTASEQTDKNENTLDLKKDQIKTDDKIDPAKMAKELAENKEQENTDPINFNDWDYTPDAADNSISITHYHGNEQNIVIPNDYDFIKAGKLNKDGKVYLKFTTAIDLRGKTNVTSLKVSSNGNGKVYLDKEGAHYYNPSWHSNWARAFQYNRFKTIDFTHLNTSNVTNMSGMFYGASDLKTIDLTGWDTSNVTDMSEMFDALFNVTDIKGLADWDTSKVTSTWYMFCNDYKLKKLDLSRWDMGNNTNSRGMFFDNYALESVGDLSHWNTSKITTMQQMFMCCQSLKDLGNLDNWDTGQVTSMQTMFGGCYNLQNVGDLSHWNMSKVTNTATMFNDCHSLKKIGDLSNWQLSSLTEMGSMFRDCYVLTTLGDLSHWDVSHVTGSMDNLFNDCKALTNLGNLDKWQTGHVKNMRQMFSEDYNLQNIGDLSKWDTSSVTDMSWMFNGCNNLAHIGDLSRWQVGHVTNMAQMFEGCLKITSLGNLSNWDVSHVTNMYCMFYYTRLGRINLSKWDMSHVTDAGWMFADELAPCIIDMSHAQLPSYHFTVQDFYGWGSSEPIIVLNHDLQYLNNETMAGQSFKARQNSNYLDIYSNHELIAKIPMDFVFDSEDAVKTAFEKATTLANIKAHLLPGKSLPANADQYSLKLQKLLKSWEDGKTDWNQLFYQVAGSYNLTLPNQPTTPVSPTTPTNPANPTNPVSPVKPDQPTQPSNIKPHPEKPTKPSGKPIKPGKQQKNKKNERRQNVQPHAQKVHVASARQRQGVISREENKHATASGAASSNSHKQNSRLPQTGQKSNNWAFLGLAVMSIAALFGVALGKKKKA